MKGFLGTGATFRADFNLVVQITMGLACSPECSWQDENSFALTSTVSHR